MKKKKAKKAGKKSAQKITPCLWFDKSAEDAMEYYVRVFNEAPKSRKKSRIVSIARYEKGIEAPQAAEMEGKVLTGIFDLDGQRFLCLDGGPYFKFNEAISMYIECADQEEVDYFWGKLSAVPESEQCGWVKDKFGLSWQVVPKRLGELLEDKDREKARKVMNAMLKMKKLVVADLEKAFRE